MHSSARFACCANRAWREINPGLRRCAIAMRFSLSIDRCAPAWRLASANRSMADSLDSHLSPPPKGKFCDVIQNYFRIGFFAAWAAIPRRRTCVEVATEVRICVFSARGAHARKPHFTRVFCYPRDSRDKVFVIRNRTQRLTRRSRDDATPSSCLRCASTLR